MALVSVIIPVYNTEQYLKKCLDSVCNQTLKDIEIICVDDGSTDNSINILTEYAKQDSRIKLLKQENKKQGAARNYGMEIATGEYIGFIDSDDWIDLNFFEQLYNAAKKYNSDIALATNIRVGNGKTKKRLNITEEKFVTTLQDKFDITKQKTNPCPTNKIYRKKMLDKNNITWPEKVYCEDKLFTLEAVYYANGIVTVPDVYYYYYRNLNSTVKKKSKCHIEQFQKDKELAYLKIVNFLREKNADIRDKEFWATTKKINLCNITLFTKKESLKTIRYYLLGIIKLWEKEI